MEEAKLARVDVDAARDAQRTVARLQRQAEMLIGNIKKECLDRDTYDTLALVAEETENGLGLSLTSPFGEGKLLFEPRISDQGAYGYYEIRKKRLDAKGELYWPVVSSFTMNRDNIIFNSEGEAVTNLSKQFHGQFFLFVLGLAATLGL